MEKNMQRQREIMLTALERMAIGQQHKLYTHGQIKYYIQKFALKARTYTDKSKYMPHQGKREIARRLRRQGA